MKKIHKIQARAKLLGAIALLATSLGTTAFILYIVYFR